MRTWIGSHLNSGELRSAATRRDPPTSRPARFVNVGSVLALVFAGYKRIGLEEKLRGSEWAEAARKRHHRWSAERFYDLAVRNQGLLIKTAQFLSSRPDVVPDEYVDVLTALQDEVPPEPFPVIRRLVEAELGRPLNSVFREFAEVPVASASLAQVHRAVLLDGRIAAVKVQYPGISDIVDIDLKNIDVFTNILRRADKTLDFRFIAEEMAKMVPLELDFLHEGHSAEAIAANFADVDDIYVPAIYWEHTTRRVLTMEFVDGVKITDTDGIRGLGLDPSDVAKVLVVAFSEMILGHGLFHADPHPGNLLVSKDPDTGQPRLILIDFGQVKDVGPEFRFLFGLMTKALMNADDSAVGRSFRDMGFRMREDRAESYEELGSAYVGNIAKQMSATGAIVADRDMFRESYRHMSRLLRNNPLIKVPADLLFVGRVLGLLNGLSLTLGARTNLLLEMSRLMDRADTPVVEGEKRRLLEV